MRKHIFLLVSIAVLTFMALTTEKKVLVTTGYAVTEEELALGQTIYQQSCSTCHEQGRNGAPSVGNQNAWKMFLAGDLAKLLRQGKPECVTNELVLEQKPDGTRLTRQEIDAATAFMILKIRK
jgi:cytochrome c5